MNFFKKLEVSFEQWLSAPATNAAGRIGLYRILYSLFFLWFFSYLRFTELALIPASQLNPPLLFSWLTKPPEWFFPIAESLLAATLVLLLVGYRTRLVTVLVFFLGFGLAGIRASLFLKEHTIMLVVFYVPLFMSFSDWGSTYSIDAILRRRRGQFVPDPKDSSWRYIWPSRGLMVVLGFLFASAAIIKFRKLDWITNPHFVSDFMLRKSVESYLNNGFPINPIVPPLANFDFFIIPAQYIVLLFEAAFILVLFNRFARAIIFRVVLIFHSFNTFFLGIPFASVLSIYLAFPDWQALYQRFYPKWLRLTWLKSLSSPVLVKGSLILAVLTGLLWDTTPIPRAVFGLFGLVDYHTIWFIIFPLSIIWIAVSIYNLRH